MPASRERVTHLVLFCLLQLPTPVLTTARGLAQGTSEPSNYPLPSPGAVRITLGSPPSVPGNAVPSLEEAGSQAWAAEGLPIANDGATSWGLVLRELWPPTRATHARLVLSIARPNGTSEERLIVRLLEVTDGDESQGGLAVNTSAPPLYESDELPVLLTGGAPPRVVELKLGEPALMLATGARGSVALTVAARGPPGAAGGPALLVLHGLANGGEDAPWLVYGEARGVWQQRSSGSLSSVYPWLVLWEEGPSGSASASASVGHSDSASASTSASVEPSATPSITSTLSSGASASGTVGADPTATPSETLTPSWSASPTTSSVSGASPTDTSTSSGSSSLSQTSSSSRTGSGSSTHTASGTPDPSTSPTHTTSAGASASTTASETGSATHTPSPSGSSTRFRSWTTTPRRTLTPVRVGGGFVVVALLEVQGWLADAATFDSLVSRVLPSELSAVCGGNMQPSLISLAPAVRGARSLRPARVDLTSLSPTPMVASSSGSGSRSSSSSSSSAPVPACAECLYVTARIIVPADAFTQVALSAALERARVIRDRLEDGLDSIVDIRAALGSTLRILAAGGSSGASAALALDGQGAVGIETRVTPSLQRPAESPVPLGLMVPMGLIGAAMVGSAILYIMKARRKRVLNSGGSVGIGVYAVPAPPAARVRSRSESFSAGGGSNIPLPDGMVGGIMGVGIRRGAWQQQEVCTHVPHAPPPPPLPFANHGAPPTAQITPAHVPRAKRLSPSEYTHVQNILPPRIQEGRGVPARA